MTRCAPLRTRVRQMGVKVETTCGVEQSLTAADYKVRATELSADLAVAPIENATLSAFLSPKAMSAGEQTMSGKVSACLVGSGAAATKPEIDQLLQISSMTPTAVMKIAIGAVTNGPFVRGEVVSQAVSLATGKVMLPCTNGDGFIYVIVTSGTFNATGAITGGTSTASATASALAVAAGWRYAPDTSNRSTGTVVFNEDGYKKTIIGAMADWSISADSSGIAKIDFTISGAKGTHADAAMVTGIVPYTTAFPVFRDALFAINRGIIGEFTPIIANVGVSLGNSVSMRKDANSTTGLVASISTARKPKITFAPEAVLAADFDLLGKMSSAATMSVGFRFHAADNDVWVFAQECQIETANEGDREGTQTADVTMNAYSTLGDGEIELVFIN